MRYLLVELRGNPEGLPKILEAGEDLALLFSKRDELQRESLKVSPMTEKRFGAREPA